jgi:hypothetical protein
VFFAEGLLSKVYAVEPYSVHLKTLNRTTNAVDSLYTSANSEGYSALVSVEWIGDSIEDGLVGYVCNLNLLRVNLLRDIQVTVGVNSTGDAALTTGGSVNPVGIIPTLSVNESQKAQATAADITAGYTD